MTKLLSRRKAVLLSTMSMAFVAMIGCNALPPAVTGPLKVANGLMNTLTPEEILAVRELFFPQMDLTPEEAEVVADVLEQANLATLEDVEALADEIAQVADDPDALQDLADENGITPEQITEFMELFEGVDAEALAEDLQ